MPVVVVMTLLSVFVAGVSLALNGTTEPGLLWTVRATADVAALCFLVPFTTSALKRLAPNRATNYLRANRRFAGLGFAVAHYVHAACFVSLAFFYPESFFTKTPLSTFIGGGIGYVFLIALTVTSFPQPTRWLGGRRWRVLHKLGSYVLWGIFTFTYAGLTAAMVTGELDHSFRLFGFTALLLGAWVLRVGGWVVSRQAAAKAREVASHS